MNIQNLAGRSLGVMGAGAPVAVIVVTYNSASVLPGLLDSLLDGLDGIDRHRIIIVDNDSHDASVELAQSHPIRPEVVETGRNAGYAAGINAAVARLSPDTDILILNPDIRLLPGSVSILQDWTRRQGVGIAVPKILHPDGSLALSLRREPSIVTVWSDSLLGGSISTRIGTGEIVGNAELYDRGGLVEWATGAALMISAEARAQVGAWDESFFLYSEEVDYMRRIRERGYAIHYVADAKVIHIGGEYMTSPFLSGLMTANRIRDYGRRHGWLRRTVFRIGSAVGAAIRSPLGTVHRASLKAALTAPRC